MLINFKINRNYLYLTFEKKNLNQILVRNFGKRPGPTDLSKVGKAFGPHAPKITTLPNAQNQQPNSLPVVHKESNESNAPKIDQNSDISSNTWSNKKSITEQSAKMHAHSGIQKGTLWDACKAQFTSSEAAPAVPSVYTTEAAPLASTSSSAEQELLNKAENKGYVHYEQTDEAKSGGAPKLTKKGLQKYASITNPPIVQKETIEIPQEKTFKGGLLVSHDENLLLTPIQTHIIIVFSVPHDKFLAIGILTSQKNKLFLSHGQIYNTNKDQYFHYLKKPKIVSPELFEENEEATIFVNRSDIWKTIDNTTTVYLENSSEIEIYNGKTVTFEVLDAMVSEGNANIVNKKNMPTEIPINEHKDIKDIIELNNEIDKNND